MEHVLTMANLKLKPSLFTLCPIYTVCKCVNLYVSRDVIPILILCFPWISEKRDFFYKYGVYETMYGL